MKMVKSNEKYINNYSDDDRSFIFKVNLKNILNKTESDNFLVDCGATTHIVFDEKKLYQF